MKKLLFLLTLLILLFPLSAVSPLSGGRDILEFTAVIPEDYGIIVPDDALLFDKFALEAKPRDKDSASYLITTDVISLGELDINEQNYSFSLIYYGNLSHDYKVRINIDPGYGWYRKYNRKDYFIPIKIDLNEAYGIENDITLEENGEGVAILNIPATGPRQAVPIMDVKMEWNNSPDFVPGVYTAYLGMSLEVV